jgi:uncharacterized protein (DUF433 family)
MSEEKYQRIEFGKHIVADQRICHGQPTFKGTRKMVHLLLLRSSDGAERTIVRNIKTR